MLNDHDMAHWSWIRDRAAARDGLNSDADHPDYEQDKADIRALIKYLEAAMLALAEKEADTVTPKTIAERRDASPIPSIDTPADKA